jgi:aspartyl-tRNA(Asn)/glutamyl-tRNA(Gln) amidotransferase subunit A
LWIHALDKAGSVYLGPTCREGALWRIRASNPEINAVLDVVPEGFRGEGALSGICVGIKSNIAAVGAPTHGGIKAYAGEVAREDARVVKRLRAAGADVVASLNMEEGALGAQTDNPWFGKTQNPLKIGYTPGGSSGGSAAAVAAGYVHAALGTDTMGSVRIPSSYCGLFGFKPSHDRAMLATAGYGRSACERF